MKRGASGPEPEAGWSRDRRGLHPSRRAAITLLEVLVTAGVTALVLGVLACRLYEARSQSRTTGCRSNLRQIVLANSLYAEDASGSYCPGASEFLRNLHRWHGTRAHPGARFDPSLGPLDSYWGNEARVRECPDLPSETRADGFELGNGGFGYNNEYIGRRLLRRPDGRWLVLDDRTGAKIHAIHQPGRTIMFADSAFAASSLIEYSFAEPRFQTSYPSKRMDPSIHFRHGGRANVGWCDGHVDGQRRTRTWRSGYYPADPGHLNLGWFGNEDNNGLFDLE